MTKPAKLTPAQAEVLYLVSKMAYSYPRAYTKGQIRTAEAMIRKGMLRVEADGKIVKAN